MINQVIADTGVIVAFLSPKDQWREWAVNQWRQLPAPFLTCEAVITEACFLLHNYKDGEQDILSLVEVGILRTDFSLSAEMSAVKNLMKKYANVPMSLADACLVRMSELTENAEIFTTDSDFYVYRKNGRQKIPLMIPK